MQSQVKLELSVGLFVIACAAALGYLAFTLAGLGLDRSRYTINARFSSVGDLKRGDPVKLAGVQVGEVKQLALVDYLAAVELSISEDLQLPRDTIASVQTSGLLGDAFVSLSPGAAIENLSPGGTIARTEPAVSISQLLSKYAFGSLGDEPAGSARKRAPSGAPEKDLLQ